MPNLANNHALGGSMNSSGNACRRGRHPAARESRRRSVGGGWRLLMIGALSLAWTTAGAGERAAPACDQWGTEAFFRYADVATVAQCLEGAADPYATAEDGDPAWFSAASHSADPDVIRLLIEAGAEVATPSERGETVLHVAARDNESVAVLRFLLANGGDVHAAGNWREATPLHYAAESNGNPAVVQALLDAGAEPKARTTHALTALGLAAGNNESVEVLRILLATGGDVDAACGTCPPIPLHEAACSNGNPAILQALLDAGADPNARTGRGSTALHAAMRDMCVWQRDNEGDIVRLLLARGADPNAATIDGDTPLHVAASSISDNAAVLATLLAAGADPNAREHDDGGTPLHLSAFEGRPAMARLLVGAGANVDARDGNGRTPAHWALTGPVIEALVALGANIDLRDERGNTPLHEAAQFGYEERHAGDLIKALLAHGANPLARNCEGRTPWDLAAENGTLRDHGPDAYGQLNEARLDRAATGASDAGGTADDPEARRRPTDSPTDMGPEVDGYVPMCPTNDVDPCGNGLRPFVAAFVDLEDEPRKLGHLRTWSPIEMAEPNCLARHEAFHFGALLQLYLLPHVDSGSLDCGALERRLNIAFSPLRLKTEHAYRMFDDVVQHLCPEAPTLSDRGSG